MSVLGLGLGLSDWRRYSGSPPVPPASNYQEIGNLGKTATAGTNLAFSAADTKYASPTITVPAGGIWFKKFILGFRTAAVGNKFKPFLYTGAGNAADPLFTEGPEYTFASAFTNTHTLITAPAKADGSAIFVPAGNYMIGILTASSGMALESAATGTFKRSPDTYSDGAAATYGTITSFGVPFLAYIPYSLGGP